MRVKNINVKDVIRLLKILIALFILIKIIKFLSVKKKENEIRQLTPEEQKKYVEFDNKLSVHEKDLLKNPRYHQTQDVLRDFFRKLFTF